MSEETKIAEEFDALIECLRVIPKPALYEQLAEESAELAKAALKISRILRGENPTPVKFDEAWTNLKEEMTDCFTVWSVLGIGLDIDIMMSKLRRWSGRIKEAGRKDKE